MYSNHVQLYTGTDTRYTGTRIMQVQIIDYMCTIYIEGTCAKYGHACTQVQTPVAPMHILGADTRSPEDKNIQ